MTVIVGPHEASPDLLTQLAELICGHVPLNDVRDEAKEDYAIDSIQKSESAWILFTHKMDRAEERYVVKLLCRYNDRRYNLESLYRRQECQVEALQRNSLFSPTVYVGLSNAYLLQAQQNRLVLGPATYEKAELDPELEYALVMRQLSSTNRLDSLVERAEKDRHYRDTFEQHMYLLLDYIINIHSASPAFSPEEGQRWGGFFSLQSKLEHNLSLADPLFAYSGPVYTDPSLKQLQERFGTLKTNLAQVIERYAYKEHFRRRVDQGHIKRCHGDLKGPNIWIEPSSSDDGYVIDILDAIDFNPMYSNIDTLSDLATLIVDIYTRLHCTDFARALAQKMIEYYLEKTGQNWDEAARAVLHYYLVEKAFVAAAISIIYDGLPKLGHGFLRAAEKWWDAYFTPSALPEQFEYTVGQQLSTLAPTC